MTDCGAGKQTDVTAGAQTPAYLDGMIQVLEGFGKAYADEMAAGLGSIKTTLEANRYNLAAGTPGFEAYGAATRAIATRERSLTAAEVRSVLAYRSANTVER